MAKECLPLTATMTQAERRLLKQWDNQLRREGLTLSKRSKHRKGKPTGLTAGYKTKWAQPTRS